MLTEHDRRLQALGTREVDIVGLQHLHDAVAQVAHENGGEAEGERESGQKQVVELVGERVAIAADGKPVQLGAEQCQQEDAEVEHRCRETDLEGGPDRVVHAAAMAEGRDERERHGQQHRQQRGEGGQEERDRQAMQDEAEHRGLVGDGVAEFALKNRSRKMPNWTRMGRSRPNWALMRVTASSVARSPISALVGSPGNRRTSTNTTTMIRKKVGMICSSLRTTYLRLTGIANGRRGQRNGRGVKASERRARVQSGA
jgi:hypothetical protein